MVLGKKKAITKQLYHLRSKFRSVDDMREKIMHELKEEIVGDIGYYEGRQSTKRWLLDDEDIHQMYSKHMHSGGEIYLWLDTNVYEGDEQPVKKKKKEEGTGSRRQEKEANVEKTCEELYNKHKDGYTKPQLRLWARMIVNDLHESYSDPPNVPMITGLVQKPKKKDTVSTPTTRPPEMAVPHSNTLSPGRCADLRMKNFEQLRYIQQLHKDSILTEAEFANQKKKILEALSNL